jgi:regulator of CtrA degradation
LIQAERVFQFQNDPVPFGSSFVKSEAFKALFREGMLLVEDTAEYLDSTGRSESARLGRTASLAYASESMRLTTRLMQVASWLLVQRAVSEGEISTDQAQREKERVRLVPQESAAGQREFDALPERFRDLVGLSLRLHARVVHLDGLMSAASTPERRTGNPVALQHDLLAMAFSAAPGRPTYAARG